MVEWIPFIGFVLFCVIVFIIWFFNAAESDTSYLRRKIEELERRISELEDVDQIPPEFK
jgi:hypothetical protein